MITPYIPLTLEQKYFKQIETVSPVPEKIEKAMAPARKVVQVPGSTPQLQLNQQQFAEAKNTGNGNVVWWVFSAGALVAVTCYGVHLYRKRKQKYLQQAQELRKELDNEIKAIKNQAKDSPNQNESTSDSMPPQ